MFYVGNIVLSINFMFREELGCFSADLVFFQAIRLPGNILLTEHPPDTPFSEHLIRQMQQFATTIQPVPTRVKQNKRLNMPPQLKTCTHIFLKENPIKPNLTPAYAGPYLVISRTDKMFLVLNNSKIMSVAVNNVKHCFQLKNSQKIEADYAVFAETNNNQLSQACHDANEVDPTSMFPSNSPSDDSDDTKPNHHDIRLRGKTSQNVNYHAITPTTRCMFNEFLFLQRYGLSISILFMSAQKFSSLSSFYLFLLLPPIRLFSSLLILRI